MQRTLLTLLLILSLFTTVACGDDDSSDSNDTSNIFGMEEKMPEGKGDTPSRGTNTPSTLPTLPSSPKQPASPTPQAQPDLGDVKLVWETSDDYKNIEQFIKEQGKLGELVNILNQSLNLPADINVIHRNCGTPSTSYDPRENAVIMCYETLAIIYSTFVDLGLGEDGAIDTALDTWYGFTIHGIALALFDNFDLSGAGESEADNFVTLFVTAANKDEIAIWYGYFWRLFFEPGTVEHSSGVLRSNRIFCTLYGSNQESHRPLIENYPEIEDTPGSCQAEYQQDVNSVETIFDPWSKN